MDCFISRKCKIFCADFFSFAITLEVLYHYGKAWQCSRAGQNIHVPVLAKIRMAKKIFGQKVQLKAKSIDTENGQYGLS